MLCRLTLLLLLAATTLSSAPTASEPPTPARLLTKVKPSALPDTVKSNEFVVALFAHMKSKKGRQSAELFARLFEAFSAHELVFAQVAAGRRSPQLGQVYVYVGGVQKHYAGALTLEALQNWLYEVYFARPRARARLADIDSIDSHYFLYVEEAYKAAHEQRVARLAKLLNPLSVLHGLDAESRGTLLRGRRPGSPLWIYREYGEEVLEVDAEQPLQALADFVARREFPDFVLPDARSLRLLLEFKVPTLLYFTADAGGEFVELLKALLLPFKEYLILTIVPMARRNRSARFLADFMGVRRAPAIRILNMSERVRRYKFIGKAQPPLIANFVQNYLAGNLEPYAVSEKLARGAAVRGVPKGNAKSFARALEDVQTAHLVYVYGAAVADNAARLDVLAGVARALGGNLHFEVQAINHDKNDLDGFFNDALPFVFLATRKGSVEHYEGEMSVGGLVDFVRAHYPYFSVQAEQVSDEL